MNETRFNSVFRQLSFGLLLTTQLVLWTACMLVVVGVGWRSVPLDPRILLFGVLVGLAATLELVLWNRFRRPRPTIEPNIANEEEIEEEEFDAGATQQIVRRRTEAGTERLEGTFLVEFLPEQKTVSVHVPFCPAFEATPSVDALLLDGDATLSVIKPRSFGVRIDVKRRDDEGEKVRILVVAEIGPAHK